MSYPRTFTALKISELLKAGDEFDRNKLLLSGKLADEIFTVGSACGPDSGWINLWCKLSELLAPLFYWVPTAAKLTDPATKHQAQQNAFAFAGAAERLIHADLDAVYRNMTSATKRGEDILTGLVAAVDELVASLDRQLSEGSTATDGGRTLSADEAADSRTLVLIFRGIVLRDIAALVGRPTDLVVDEQWVTKPKGEIAKRVWLRALADPGAPLRSLPGVMCMTKAIAGALMTNSGVAAGFDDNDPYAILTRDPGGVPQSVAKMFSDTRWLITHRKEVAERYDYHRTGINDPGTTELDRLAFQYIFDGADQQRSFVVLAPTSSGKSRLGQLAVIEAVNRAKSGGRPGGVVVLVPTKALVNQTARDFRQLLVGDTETAEWSVFEGSRDYPQFDERIRTGRFDIAVCIPEKLSALLRIGMSLADTPLVVVDELQHLVDESRGQALELLMVELFREYPHLRWIGLSASLSIDTQRMVELWFKRNNREDITVYRAEFRPVPVVLAATDGQRYVQHSPDLANSTKRGPLATPALGVQHLVQDLRDRHIKRSATTYHRTLSVVCAALKSASEEASDAARPELPSILVFVSSRKAAEALPTALEAVARLAGVLAQISPRARPYIAGRFSPFPVGVGDQPRPKELLADLELIPPGSIRRNVTAALNTGIGFHTSTLDGPARVTVEEAFRHGYIRVLFTTDTLRLGVNLPTDIAINSDLILNTGGGQRLLDKDAVIQRFGRAGRLGVSRGRRGTGYLVVPESVNVRDPTRFEIGIDERKGLTGDADSKDSAVLSAVTDLDAAFRCYLGDLGGGATYRAVLNDTWFHDAVIRMLCATESLRLSTEDLRGHAKRLFDSSFPGVLGNPYPDNVLERLEHTGAVRSSDGITQVTRIGRIAAGNGYGLAATDTVTALAASATGGAGPFTLLYVACLSDAARTASSFQMLCDDRMPIGIRKQILQGAAKLGGYRRPTTSTKISPYFRLQDHSEDLLGSGQFADELRAVLAAAADESAVYTLSNEQVTAIWRATVLCHWWGGSSMLDIETMVDAGKWQVDESDVRLVAEAAANLLAAASDYLGTAPVDMTFRSLLVFSQEVEMGLPIILTSLVRTNDRLMHRERLIGLLPLLLDPARRWDQLTDLLSVYAEKRNGIPAGGSQTGPTGWRPLTSELLAKIEGHLQEQEELYRQSSLVVSSRVATCRIPADGPTMTDRLRSFQAGTGVNDIHELMPEFGFTVQDLPSIDAGGQKSYGVQVGSDDTVPPTHVVVAEVRIDHAFVDQVVARLDEGGNAIVVATMGATPGVLDHSRFLTTPCAVVEPSLLLEMLARVHEACTEEPADEADEWDTAPVFDIDTAQRLLARMIVNNAPVLTRQDLESRLVHDKLAE